MDLLWGLLNRIELVEASPTSGKFKLWRLLTCLDLFNVLLCHPLWSYSGWNALISTVTNMIWPHLMWISLGSRWDVTLSLLLGIFLCNVSCFLYLESSEACFLERCEDWGRVFSLHILIPFRWEGHAEKPWQGLSYNCLFLSKIRSRY